VLCILCFLIPGHQGGLDTQRFLLPRTCAAKPSVAYCLLALPGPDYTHQPATTDCLLTWTFWTPCKLRQLSLDILTAALSTPLTFSSPLTFPVWTRTTVDLPTIYFNSINCFHLVAAVSLSVSAFRVPFLFYTAIGRDSSIKMINLFCPVVPSKSLVNTTTDQFVTSAHLNLHSKYEAKNNKKQLWLLTLNILWRICSYMLKWNMPTSHVQNYNLTLVFLADHTWHNHLWLLSRKWTRQTNFGRVSTKGRRRREKSKKKHYLKSIWAHIGVRYKVLSPVLFRVLLICSEADWHGCSAVRMGHNWFCVLLLFCEYINDHFQVLCPGFVSFDHVLTVNDCGPMSQFSQWVCQCKKWIKNRIWQIWSIFQTLNLQKNRRKPTWRMVTSIDFYSLLRLFWIKYKQKKWDWDMFTTCIPQSCITSLISSRAR